MWPKEWDSSARSSAYSKSSKLLPEIQWMLVDLPSIVCLVTQSINNSNRNGDSMQPCHVPVFTLKGSVSPRPWITLHTESLYWHMMILISFSGTPWCLRIFHNVSLSTLSKAFSKSMKLMCSDEFHSSDCSMMILSVMIWSLQDLCWRKPACSSRSLQSNASFSPSNMILLSTFPAVVLQLKKKELHHHYVVIAQKI